MPPWSDLVRVLRLDLIGFLVVAVLLGGAVGLEREVAGKPAGLRTNILICVGAALFTQLSITLAGATGDKGRIAAQIVTGVGFLGAGTILHGKGIVTGLTSAATIWLVAAIGVAVGAGEVYEAGAATLVVLVVLLVLGRVERYLSRRGEVSRLTVEVEPGPDAARNLEQIARGAGVSVDEMHTELRNGRLVVELELRGSRHAQDAAKLSLLRASAAYTVALEE